VEEYRNPAYATALGLVLEAYEREKKNAAPTAGEVRIREPRDNALEKLLEWFKQEFF
jgi:DNA-binding IclR family transcriptional regulator